MSEAAHVVRRNIRMGKHARINVSVSGGKWMSDLVYASKAPSDLDIESDGQLSLSSSLPLSAGAVIVPEHSKVM
jgi:hypothetical protein